MAEAAYATGPALLGAPRLLSSIFPRIFCSLFHRGAQMVRQCGAPKSLSSPENVRPQNLKSEAPKSGAPNGFFVLCFSAGAQTAQVPQKTRGPARPKNLKREGPKGILFPAVSVSARDPKEPMVPRKLEAPKFKNRGPKERGPKWFFRSLFQRGIQTAWAPIGPNAKPNIKKMRGPKV